MEWEGFKVTAMSKGFAEEIATWQYPPPYTIYSLSNSEVPILMDPEKWYFAVLGVSGSLAGYCCYGKEAQVGGGDYEGVGDRILDVGVGMRPEMTGKGLGKSFVEEVLIYGSERFSPRRFRVTVAAFNKRSLRTFLSLGFVKTQRFNRPGDIREFIQLEREATPDQ
jgi:RimJ/RimL family protein N-acetyltransferase